MQLKSKITILLNKFLKIFINKTKITNFVNKNIVDQFHLLYFNSWKKTIRNTYWLGVPTIKCPLDCWIYQEIIYKIKPDLIIECGTSYGGSALFIASLFDLIDNGKVITIDISEEKKNKPQHKRIQYLIGSSISNKIIKQVKSQISANDKVMVILDSDHKKGHVLNELKIYSKFVSKGSYLIVEDSNINGHPVLPNFGLGPMEAIEDFLKENKNFIIDKTKEKFFLTFNPNGYLKRIK